MTNPTVLIDGIVFENAHQIGIWRTFYEVMRRTSGEINYILLLSNAAVQPIPDGVEVLELRHRNAVRRRQLIARYKRRASINHIIRQFKDAVWHSTFFSLDPRPEKCSVVSVYDMVAEQYFLMTPSFSDQIRTKRTAIHEASAILAISSTTAAELGRFSPQFIGNFSVAKLGSEHLRVSTGLESDDRGPPYCLFVGARTSYKNFICLIKATASEAWPKHVKVKVIGSNKSDDEHNLLEYYGVAGLFEFVGPVPDDALSRLYAQAQCFVFPSLGEGFGLPTVESQLNKCLPVVSDLPIFHEVAGDAALFFNPHSPVSLAETVAKALHPDVRRDLVSRCAANAKRFSWDDTAERTVNCYRSVWQNKLQKLYRG